MKRYVITSAQSSTEVNLVKLASLKNYCKQVGAEMMVLPLKYNTKRKADFGYDPEIYEVPEYDPEIVDLLLTKEVVLNSNMTVIPHIHAMPTAQDPLSGMASVSFDKSAIFAGVKHRFLTVPTPGHKLPKILSVAPAITRPNFSETSAGHKAKFYHTYGALVVEVVDNKIFHLRQLTIDSQNRIYDLQFCYEPGKKRKKVRIEAAVYGDLHHMWADPGVVAATFSDRYSMLNVLKPKVQMFHDFIDFYSQNHHHVGDRLLEYLKRKEGMDNVEDELMAAFEFLHKYTPKNCESIIVASNHNDATDRWLNSGRGDYDPVNAAIYHLLNYYKYANAKLKGPSASTINPLESFVDHYCPEYKERIRFLKRDESFQRKGIELTYHGDVGPNGARGNVKSFSNIGCKTIVGHGHSPQWFNWAMMVGTSSLMNMGYNSGPSGWLHTHGLVYENGERAFVTVIDNQWRG